MKSVRICDKSQSEFPIDVVKCPNCGSFSSHYGIGEGEENTEKHVKPSAVSNNNITAEPKYNKYSQPKTNVVNSSSPTRTTGTRYEIASCSTSVKKIRKTLNKYAKMGWRYVDMFDGTVFVVFHRVFIVFEK